MAKATLKIRNRKDPYLRDTMVENLFIYEFLPSAPGEFVKVYLFGLMCAQNGEELDTAKTARVLHMSETDVMKGWDYWAQKGLIELSQSAEGAELEIVYVSLVDDMYGRVRSTSAAGSQKRTASEEDAVSKVINREIQEIFKQYESATGRMISSEDAWKISDAIGTYGISPDMMSYSVDYCVGEGRSSVNQIVKTAIKWAQEGCRNLAEAREYVDRHSQRNAYYNMIFREMGFARLPNPMDREMMDKWFDELEFSIKDVLTACRAAAGLRDPSLKYVNRVLENQRLQQGGINTKSEKVYLRRENIGSSSGGSEQNEIRQAPVSKKVLKEYYDYIRLEGEREQDARIDELCGKLIAMRDLYEFENNLNREMLSLSFDDEGRDRRKLIREQRAELGAERKRLLVENGYSEDYLDRKYRCSICKDTGITDDGRVCACREQRAKEAFKWNQERNR